MFVHTDHFQTNQEPLISAYWEPENECDEDFVFPPVSRGIQGTPRTLPVFFELLMCAIAHIGDLHNCHVDQNLFQFEGLPMGISLILPQSQPQP